MQTDWDPSKTFRKRKQFRSRGKRRIRVSSPSSSWINEAMFTRSVGHCNGTFRYKILSSTGTTSSGTNSIVFAENVAKRTVLHCVCAIMLNESVDGIIILYVRRVHRGFRFLLTRFSMHWRIVKQHFHFGNINGVGFWETWWKDAVRKRSIGEVLNS